MAEGTNSDDSGRGTAAPNQPAPGKNETKLKDVRHDARKAECASLESQATAEEAAAKLALIQAEAETVAENAHAAVLAAVSAELAAKLETDKATSDLENVILTAAAENEVTKHQAKATLAAAKATYAETLAAIAAKRACAEKTGDA